MNLRPVIITAVIGAVVAGAAVVTVFALSNQGDGSDGDRRSPHDDHPACVPLHDQSSGALPPGSSFSFEKETPGVNGVTLTHAAAFAAGELSVDEEGRDWQSGTVTVDQKLTADGKAKLRWFDASGTGYSGQSLSYQLVVPAVQASRLARTHPPTPFDPESIPVGGSVTMGKSTYVGAGFSATFKALTGSVNLETGTEISTAVTRLDDHRVRVTVGPAEYVNNGVSIGLGTDDARLSVDLARRISESHLEQFDFDLSRPDDEDSYYALVFGGGPPKSVRDRATISGLDYVTKRGISLKIGNFGASVGGSGGGSLLVTTHADGRVESHAAVKDGDRSATRDDEYDADGNPIPERNIYRLILRNAGEDQLMLYNAVYANQPNVKINGRQNFVLTFTPDDFAELRYQALEILAYAIRIDEQLNVNQFREFGGDDADPEDVRRWLSGLNTEHRESVAKRFDTFPVPFVPEAYRLYAAEDDGEILAQIFSRLQGPLIWLNDWSVVLAEARDRDDRVGVGDGLCRGATKVGPPPKVVSCPDVGFTPNSDDVAFKIRSLLVPCKEVESFLRALRNEGGGTRKSFSFQHFTCRLIKYDRAAMYAHTYQCDQGPRWFQWIVAG